MLQDSFSLGPDHVFPLVVVFKTGYNFLLKPLFLNHPQLIYSAGKS